MKFQFQTGSIKRDAGYLVAEDTVDLFQFQTGSIKSFKKSKPCKIELEFQFQTGSIKRSSVTCPHLVFVGLFQFQTGSIKRMPIQCATGFQQGFNSKLVRLKGSNGEDMFEGKHRVSIPNWFD